MRKIKKIINIAVIFTLIGVFLCSNLAYSANLSLRVPMGMADDRVARFFEEVKKRESAEHLCLAYEAALLKGFLDVLKPEIVVANERRGTVTLAPIKHALEREETEVIAVRANSSSADWNPTELKIDIFPDEILRRLVTEQPTIVIVDGSDSISKRSSEGQHSHYPAAHKIFRNYFIALNEALGFNVKAEDFFIDEKVLTSLRQSPTYGALVEKIKKIIVETSQLKPYRIGFWTPTHTKLDVRSFIKEGDGPNAIIPPILQPHEVRGPTVVIVQSLMRHEDIVTNAEAGDVMAKWVLSKSGSHKHDPRYFNDFPSLTKSLDERFVKASEEAYQCLVDARDNPKDSKREDDFQSVYINNLKPETRQSVIEFKKKLETITNLEDKFNLLIPKLLIKGFPWTNFHTGMGDVRLLLDKRLAFLSSMELFEIFENSPTPEKRREKVKLAQEIALELDGKKKGWHYWAVNRIAASYWQEWHRQADFTELKVIAKYKILIGIPEVAYRTWLITGKYPTSEEQRLDSIRVPKGGGHSDVVFVIKVPSFITGEDVHATNLPNIGDEQLPSGFMIDSEIPKDIRDNYKALEEQHSLASIDFRYMDVEATLELSERMRVESSWRGRISDQQFQTVTSQLRKNALAFNELSLSGKLKHIVPSTDL